MTGYNLPPGCNESDIPGNRPEDLFMERYIEDHLDDTDMKARFMETDIFAEAYAEWLADRAEEAWLSGETE